MEVTLLVFSLNLLTDWLSDTEHSRITHAVFCVKQLDGLAALFFVFYL